MEFLSLSENTPNILNFVNFNGLFPALIIIVLTFLVVRGSTRSLDAIGEKLPSRRLFFKQLSVISRFLLICIGSVFAVTTILDLSGEGFSFFGGLVLFGISFASKDILASVMSGLTLLFDRPFQVGDRIHFEGLYGEVTEIGLRSVRIVGFHIGEKI